jgi:hypothetical protein
MIYVDYFIDKLELAFIKVKIFLGVLTLYKNNFLNKFLKEP